MQVQYSKNEELLLTEIFFVDSVGSGCHLSIIVHADSRLALSSVPQVSPGFVHLCIILISKGHDASKIQRAREEVNIFSEIKTSFPLIHHQK